MLVVRGHYSYGGLLFIGEVGYARHRHVFHHNPGSNVLHDREPRQSVLRDRNTGYRNPLFTGLQQNTKFYASCFVFLDGQISPKPQHFSVLFQPTSFLALFGVFCG
jgi:hypothetical protein